MKNRFFTSIRWKIIFVFVLSIILSITCVYFLLVCAAVLSGIEPIGRILHFFEYSIGVIPLIMLACVVLFIGFFFLLTGRTVKYIEEISSTLQRIAQGQFDIEIPVRSSDELGELAENINRMAVQLKTSIEDERNAEKTKNELVTSVSHDLRTPLTSILGYLGLIVNDRYRNEVELRYYADIAFQKSLRLKKLIDELFEFTRVSYGGIKLNFEKLNLGELLEQLTEEFFPIFQDAGMECRLSVPEERIYVMADGDLLVRVFENLITNAIRYGREGKYVDIRLLKEDGKAVVRVINYGAPIPQQDLPYIFERFYRVERSRSEATGGTGLGLAIAKNIVELHGGEISAFSNPKETVFEVKL